MTRKASKVGAALTHIGASGEARMVDVSEKAVTAREAVARGADEHDLVVGEGVVANAPVTGRGADDAELEPALRHELDDRASVVHLERDADTRVRGLELAKELRHDDRGGACGGADREEARKLAFGLRRELVEHLRLEREQPLRAPIEPASRLGRLDATARAVEELGAEALLEGPHLERDRRLGDSQLLGRL